MGNKYKDIIQELERKIPVDNITSRNLLRSIKSYLSSQNIPLWYLVHLKALCSIYKVDIETASIPSEILGVKIYYANDLAEVIKLLGKDEKRFHYNNHYNSDDISFMSWATKDYSKIYNEMPEFAIVYMSSLWFVSKERYETAQKSLENDKNRDEIE